MDPPEISRPALPMIRGKDDPYLKLAQYDFTRAKPRNVEQALNDTLLNQVRSVPVI